MLLGHEMGDGATSEINIDGVDGGDPHAANPQNNQSMFTAEIPTGPLRRIVKIDCGFGAPVGGRRGPHPCESVWR